MDEVNKTPQTVEVTTVDTKPKVEVKIERGGPLTQFSTSDSTSVQLQEISDKVSQILADLPEYIGNFVYKYQKPLINVGLILGALVALKLTFVLLGAIDEIPLLSPTLELIGLTYTTWFVWRYLLQASTRQELSQEIENFKSQFLGKK